MIPRLDFPVLRSIEMTEESLPSGLAARSSDLNYDFPETTYLSSPGGTSEVALQPLRAKSVRHNENLDGRAAGLREFTLPPVDGGKDAWLCLVGGFMLEMMVWGMSLYDILGRGKY